MPDGPHPEPIERLLSYLKDWKRDRSRLDEVGKMLPAIPRLREPPYRAKAYSKREVKQWWSDQAKALVRQKRTFEGAINRCKKSARAVRKALDEVLAIPWVVQQNGDAIALQALSDIWPTTTDFTRSYGLTVDQATKLIQFRFSGSTVDAGISAGRSLLDNCRVPAAGAAAADQGDETPSTPSHSLDFTFVNWYGTEYTFALGVQSSAVQVLWDEWKKSGLGLHQDTIRNTIDAERDSFRMDKAFRKHPAFGTMIQNTGDGKYKLAAPEPKMKESAGIPAKARRKPR